LLDFSSFASNEIFYFSTLFLCFPAKADAKIDKYFLSVQAFLKLILKFFQEAFLFFEPSEIFISSGDAKIDSLVFRIQILVNKNFKKFRQLFKTLIPGYFSPKRTAKIRKAIGLETRE